MFKKKLAESLLQLINDSCPFSINKEGFNSPLQKKRLHIWIFMRISFTEACDLWANAHATAHTMCNICLFLTKGASVTKVGGLGTHHLVWKTDVQGVKEADALLLATSVSVF